MIHYVGAGGGYNEREGVEYLDRDESDEEFDEVCSISLFVLWGYLGRLSTYTCMWGVGGEASPYPFHCVSN